MNRTATKYKNNAGQPNMAKVNIITLSFSVTINSQVPKAKPIKI